MFSLAFQLSVTSDNDPDRLEDEKFKKKLKQYQEKFDENALTLYSTMFILFNIGYWLYYLLLR